MTTATYECRCCGKPFTARTADRARGWARFCSKSCKAIRQTQRTGNAGPRESFQMSQAELAMGGYGDSDDRDGLPIGHGKW